MPIPRILRLLRTSASVKIFRLAIDLKFRDAVSDFADGSCAFDKYFSVSAVKLTPHE